MPLPFASMPLSQDDVTYEYGADSTVRPDVRPGTVERISIGSSERFPGTTRTVWVHRTAGHRADEPSAVMFFNDGWWYLDPDSDVRGGVVLDNLAARGDVPQMIGVFVDPGVIEVDGLPTKHRNAEYDAFDDTYAGFLLQEVLPIVQTRFAVSDDPMMRGICGGSSGGNAAVTAAWCRPDGIGRVIAFNPSFAQMPDGNPFPTLLASEPRRQTRIVLHAAHRDLHWNEPEGNWFAESLETAASLARAGYDFRLVLGDGGHSPNHGGVLLPDALRWLWRPHGRW
ncbi:alpha/beta hydrolase [Microbacterium sp. M1A1_1b]|uniref:alpha/beta hydrolase n=1 Tax=Curtobacterium sp. VKM Ac-2922 TaxID=2929475 RepID=UPI001FB3E434|nr:alpha/beta hydrolase-fold protein [Curtobacterium sp. VKM Ac-2922]MCJ1712929.1 alpha/beta hydrolase-fold protein [Curtobacterium sp. VKM Ac-2922]